MNSPQDDAAIRVRGLTRSYGGHVAVDHIDLDVRRGETFALLGPNGAGKTTTVEILEGHRRRDGGDVHVLGADPQVAGLDWRARIGVVLQSGDDSASLTVSELVHHFAGYYPRPRDPDEVVDAVGLRDKAGSRARTLSGGQRRRLDVALGIVGNPELLFLDEPTTGFDPQARRHFWELIEGLSRDGTTILLTTHYLDEAERLADRVGVISAGRLVEVSTPATLGGRLERGATVLWTDTSGPHQVRTDSPTAVVRELALAAGGEVRDLQVVRPSLEEIYLSMVGDVADEPTDEAAARTMEALR